MDALADGPHLGFAGKRREGLDRDVGHDFIELEKEEQFFRIVSKFIRRYR